MSRQLPDRFDRTFRPRRWILSMLLPALPWAMFDVAEAQRPATNQELNPTPELFERPTEIHPQSGPPGTRVTVRGLHLPALTPVNIGFGGTRSGFEGVAFVLTNRYGVAEEAVVVPEWADREGTHRFIIFDAYFDPISMTELFHVTDSEGKLVREGEVIEARSECAAMEGADQELYYLLGDVDGVEVGDQIIVEARIVQSGECGDGIHLELESVRR